MHVSFSQLHKSAGSGMIQQIIYLLGLKSGWYICLSGCTYVHTRHPLPSLCLIGVSASAVFEKMVFMFLLATLQTQVSVGFGRVESDLPDLDLDYPNAKKLFADYKAEAVRSGWLSAEGD